MVLRERTQCWAEAAQMDATVPDALAQREHRGQRAEVQLEEYSRQTAVALHSRAAAPFSPGEE